MAEISKSGVDHDMQEVYGVWVRSHHGKTQVLIEVGPGEWKQVFLEQIASPVCAIINPSGIRAAPFVSLEDFNPKE